jgi:hypothetical protein
MFVYPLFEKLSFPFFPYKTWANAMFRRDTVRNRLHLQTYQVHPNSLSHFGVNMSFKNAIKAVPV